MLANATILSETQARAYGLVRLGQALNENTARPAEGHTASIPYWPLAVIAFGLSASVAWTAGLLYGAYRLAWCLMS